jgi:hypothetical protein
MGNGFFSLWMRLGAQNAAARLGAAPPRIERRLKLKERELVRS